MYKGYRIRIYPTKEQEKLIWDHIHASRFIWNYMLDLQIRNYNNGGKFITDYSMHKLLTPMRKQSEYLWLNNVSIHMLQRTCGDLSCAYKYFFIKQNGFPKFKSRKHSKSSFPASSDNFYFKNNFVHIQKIGKIKYKSDFMFPYGKGHKYLNIRVSFVDNKYFVSFAMECEKQTPILNEYALGIDLGIKELAVVACNGKQFIYHNINKSKKIRDLQKRISYYQKAVFRKYEQSKKRNNGKYVKTNNIIKQEDLLRKLFTKKSNIHKNYIHQVTHEIISMLPKSIIMENLNVAGMLKNRHISPSLQEQCFYIFKEQIKYKALWSDIEFYQADRFFPSSKTCSCCGAIKKDLKLSDRVYVCNECGLIIDRDYNAAINLSKYIV